MFKFVFYNLRSCRHFESSNVASSIKNMSYTQPDAIAIIKDAVRSVKPSNLINMCLSVSSTPREKSITVKNKRFCIFGDIHIIGFGKASLGMALKCKNILGEYLKGGIISVPFNTEERLAESLKKAANIQVFKGAKSNLPDSDSMHATTKMIEYLQSLPPEDLVLILISGGGSALLSLPTPGVTLEDKVFVIRLLSSAGATISELNTVRKRLSLVKGGGLVKFIRPNRFINLVISDVVGDPIDFIASGPTVPNKDEPFAALNILQKYLLLPKIPRCIVDAVNTITTNEDFNTESFIIGNNNVALTSAFISAERLGYIPIVLSESLEGVVGPIAQFYSLLSLEICNIIKKQPSSLNALLGNSTIRVNPDFKKLLTQSVDKLPSYKGLCILSGGETTVLVQGKGRGGRNQEMALYFSRNLQKLETQNKDVFKNVEICLVAAGTDGIEADTDVAGATGSLKVAEEALNDGLCLDSFLTNNNSYEFYKKLDNGKYFVTTGPTGTNVMDVHVLIISNQNCGV